MGGRVYFNLEVNANVLGDKYNSKKAGNPDWVFNALGGLVIKLGKTHKKVVEEAPEPVAPPVIPEKREPVTPKKAEPVAVSYTHLAERFAGTDVGRPPAFHAAWRNGGTVRP